MPGDRSIHLREAGEEWIAVDEDTDEVGRGPTAQAALTELEGGTSQPTTATETTSALEDVYSVGNFPTISPKIEVLFGIAAVGIGGVYLLTGNVSGALLVVVGIALLVRVAWIEYGLFGPQQ